MDIKGNLRKITELGIGITAVATLALAGCGGGGSGSSGGGNSGNNNNNVVTIAGLVSTFAGTSLSWGVTDGASSVAKFVGPAYMTSDGTNLYVADTDANNIRKINIATGIVSTLAGSTTGASGVLDSTTGTSALFNSPNGIATDGTNLYVADSGNNNIRQIAISTGAVTTLAGSTTGASGITNATGTSARFNFPVGITRIGTNLYVTDYASHNIRKIDLTNNVVTLFAGDSLGRAGYSTGGAGTSARFNHPAGLTTDNGTNLYVADETHNNIRQVNISTQMVSTLAGSSWKDPTLPILGINGSGSTDGTGTAARFNAPLGVTSDGTNLYVSDTLNHTIRKIVISSGVVTTLAGTVGASGVTDATGTSAKFAMPRGLIYLNGALYVADWYNGSIRKIQ